MKAKIDTTRKPDNGDFHGLKSWRAAQEFAKECTVAFGYLFLAADRGASTWPRYCVVEAPRLGEEVSKYFNGDAYPCGKIVKVSRPPFCRRVETDKGYVFHRAGLGATSATWKLAGGTWSMVPGIRNDYNREF